MTIGVVESFQKISGYMATSQFRVYITVSNIIQYIYIYSYIIIYTIYIYIYIYILQQIYIIYSRYVYLSVVRSTEAACSFKRDPRIAGIIPM